MAVRVRIHYQLPFERQAILCSTIDSAWSGSSDSWVICSTFTSSQNFFSLTCTTEARLLNFCNSRIYNIIIANRNSSWNLPSAYETCTSFFERFVSKCHLRHLWCPLEIASKHSRTFVVQPLCIQTRSGKSVNFFERFVSKCHLRHLWCPLEIASEHSRTFVVQPLCIQTRSGKSVNFVLDITCYLCLWICTVRCLQYLRYNTLLNVLIAFR